VNAHLTLKAFERAGVAGINIEDQSLPKRCGHVSGKELLPFEEAVGKIRAAAEARVDPDFVINARTDALAVAGYDEAVRRANAFLEVGATMAFIEATGSLELMRDLVRDIRGPVAVNLVEGGKSPQRVKFSELEEIGVARVSLPSTAMQAAIHAMYTVFRRVQQEGGVGCYGELLSGFGVAQRLVGLAEINALEDRYLRPSEESTSEAAE
jgi:methylisocitrate lyase